MKLFSILESGKQILNLSPINSLFQPLYHKLFYFYFLVGGQLVQSSWLCKNKKNMHGQTEYFSLWVGKNGGGGSMHAHINIGHITSEASVWARIAVKGSSLFIRLSSFGIIASFNGHSRSPLWWPKAPHLTHLTLRISIPNGLALPATPVSNLEVKNNHLASIYLGTRKAKATISSVPP